MTDTCFIPQCAQPVLCKINGRALCHEHFKADLRYHRTVMDRIANDISDGAVREDKRPPVANGMCKGVRDGREL